MAIRAELTSGRLFHDFATWCTIACLNRIASSNWWMPLIFTFIFFNMLFMLVYVSVLCVLKYLSLPIATDTTITVTSQKFPRVSICNENPLKRSVVDRMPEFEEISRLLNQFERIARNQTTDDDYGLRNVRGFMHRQRRARLMLRLLMAKLPEETRRAGGYQFTEILSECSYAGKTCSSLDFSWFSHPDFGNCYTFSIEANATRPGRSQGLRLLMTVNQQPTDKGPFDYLSTTESSSVMAVIHDDGAFPDFTKDGFRVASGTQALAALTKVEYSRISRPYGNCSYDGSEKENFYENYTYTHSICQASWLQMKGVEICGCADPLYHKNESHRYCTTPDEMLCLKDLTHTISPATKKGHICDCPLPCTETDYKKVVSNSVFPSDKYLVSIGTQAQRDALLKEQNGGRPGQCNDGADVYDDVEDACSTSQGPTTTTSSGSTTTVTTDDTSITTYSDHSTTSSSPDTTTTVHSEPTTTINRQQCPRAKPDDKVFEELLNSDADDCKNDAVYSNFHLTVITGWPCLSQAKCKSCVLIKNQSDPLAWPCNYMGYPAVCKDRETHAVHPAWCPELFEKFDFINMGTSEPVFKWQQGEGPANANCGSANNCDRDIKCAIQNVTVNVSTNPLLDPEFAKLLVNMADPSPCQVSKLARDMANAGGGATVDSKDPGLIEKIVCGIFGCPDKSSGKRKKRSAAPAGQPARAVAVDLPGLVDLLSDVSGHAGLWLGMSVISVVELIGFIAMWLLKCCCPKKIKITDEEVVDGAIKRGREDKKMYEK